MKALCAAMLFLLSACTAAVHSGGARSYTTDYASPSQNSRVDAPVKTYSALVQVGDARNLRQGYDSLGDPEFVLLDPTGERHVIKESVRIRTIEGKTLVGDTGWHAVGHVAGWGFIIGDVDRRWDGRTFDGYDNYQERSLHFDTALGPSGALQFASRLTEARWTSVGQTFRGPHDSGRESVLVYSRAMKDDPVPIMKPPTSEWKAVVDGSGVAAIADDGRIVVATQDGKLLAWNESGHKVVDVRISAALGQEEQLASASVIGDDLVLSSKTKMIRRLSIGGEKQWETRVQFEPMQPAIDGGGGRVYVAGRGLVALENGKLLWSKPFTEVARATAFGDGTLAVSVGKELLIIAPNGDVRQRLLAREPILTPPAIGPDGKIWVATEKRLLVAGP